MGFLSWFRKSAPAEPSSDPRSDEPEVETSAEVAAGVPESASDAPDDVDALGWDAITAVFDAAYVGQEPQHWGVLIPWTLGGPDPLRGVSAYRGVEPVPYWHYVTYGYSDLFGDLADAAASAGKPAPEASGYGIEMTMRLADPAAADPDATAPVWPISLLQNVARYVFQTGNVIYAGHYLGAGGPIALDEETELVVLGFVEDPVHPEPLATPYGEVRFVQAVGLTSDEADAAASWNTRRLVEVIGRAHGYGLTDLSRRGIETEPRLWAEVQEASRAEGSSSSFFNVETLRVTPQGDDLVIDLKGSHGTTFRAIASRIGAGQAVRLIGDHHVLDIVPQTDAVIRDAGETESILSLTAEGAAALPDLPDSPFESRVDAAPGIIWRVAAPSPAE